MLMNKIIYYGSINNEKRTKTYYTESLKESYNLCRCHFKYDINYFYFYFYIFDADVEWLDGYFEIPFMFITSVTFDSRYCNQWENHLKNI